MKISRRTFVQTASTLPFGVASAFAQSGPLPIVFVHGNGDTAGLWITTFWRFESNGYPRDLLHAVDLRYPQAQSVDGVVMPGRSSSADVMKQLAEEVAVVKKRTGAAKVVLVAQSRGGNTVRNYLKNGGGAEHTALAILCGAVNHGVVVSDTFLVGSEFNGASAFMRDLNSTPGEVVAGVRMVTIRSLDNDKFAQPDGRYLGQPGTPTGLTFAAPELAGAENIVIPKLDHRETGYAPEAFAAIYKAVTGVAPKSVAITSEPTVVLDGKISSFEAEAPTNIGVTGAKVTVYKVAADTGERQGEALLSKVTGADGRWGPLTTAPNVFHEFVVEIAGMPTTHIYRSPFPRSSGIVNIRPQPLAKGEAEAAAVVYLQRPRGYFGAGRDTVELGGKPAAGIPEGVATVSTAKLVIADAVAAAVPARFNDERITARTWPMKDGHVSVVELTS